MDKNFAEEVRLLNEEGAKLDYGPEAEAAINPTPDEYDNNPVIEEYKQRGFELINANYFGMGNERGEILIFRPKKEKKQK